MAQMSVAQFAGELKVPPSVLLEQLKAAGVNKRVAEDVYLGNTHDVTRGAKFYHANYRLV